LSEAKAIVKIRVFKKRICMGRCTGTGIRRLVMLGDIKIPE
jgi:hypothetical protein